MVTGEFAVEIVLSKFPTEQTMIYHVQKCIYWVQPLYIHIYSNLTKTNGFAMLFYVHAALEHVQAMYEPGTSNVQIYLCMYYFMYAKSKQHKESNPGSLAWNPAILTPLLAALMQGRTKFLYMNTLPGGW